MNKRLCKAFALVLSLSLSLIYQDNLIISATTHSHNDNCYNGTKHSHTLENCQMGYFSCTAGCTIHNHSVEGCTSEVCNGSLRLNYTGALPGQCPLCYYNGFDLVQFDCTTCGVSFWLSTQNNCPSCGNDLPYGIQRRSNCGKETFTCGKDNTKSYLNGVVCQSCSGTAKVYRYSCNKIEGEYYNTSGIECNELCNKVVTNLSSIK